MAISRSLMNRQLRADGGIMQVAPREKFRLGSKLKKFVRKIIPNEVSEIAVKAAPFVAPFNPLLAAGMSGIGSFDQTGRIGDSLKSGALTYGLGQGARYLGGADFQGLQNPFAKDAFSMPTGSGGIKNLFKKDVQPIQGVGDNIIVPKQKPTNILAEQLSEVSLDPSGAIIDTASSTVTTPGSAMESLKSVVSFETSAADKGKAALDLLKRGSKTLFYDKDGNLDKAAVLGAVTAAASYAEALMLAKDAGVELTEEEYDQAQRDEKKEEYAGYLQNFFGGKKDGGRIGFESGANEMIKTQLLEEIMPNTDTTTEDYVIIMTEDGPRMILKSNLPSESMMMDTTTSVFGDAGRGREIPQELRANGGRIGFKKGSPEETSEIGIMAIDVEAGDDDDMEDMDMAAGINFSRQEKSYLFRRLGGSGGSDRSYTMPNLYKILSNPNKYPEDAAILKEIAIMGLGGGRKDGGRIGYKDGKSLGDILEHGYFMQGPTEKEDFEYYRDLDERLKKAEKDSIEEDVSTIEDIFKRDTPQTEGKFGLSEGFTFSPITLLRRFLAKKELENRADGGRIGFNQGSTSIGNTVFGDMSEIDIAESIKESGRGLINMFSPSEIMRILSEAGEGFKQLYFNLKSDSEKESLLKTIMGDSYEQKAKGGRIGFADGTPDKMEQYKKYVSDMIKDGETPVDFEEFLEMTNYKDGGRIGYKKGANRVSELLILRDNLLANGEDVSDIEAEIFQLTGKTFKSVGGISDIPTGKIRKNSAGVVERDYRDEGGFVPVGIKERADDVPAMLSKNEFVMTADAVRGIGNGSVEEGSKKLYNTMKKAEQVGKA